MLSLNVENYHVFNLFPGIQFCDNRRNCSGAGKMARWLRALGSLLEYLSSFLAPTLPAHNQHPLLASTGSYNTHAYLPCGYIHVYHI